MILVQKLINPKSKLHQRSAVEWGEWISKEGPLGVEEKRRWGERRGVGGGGGWGTASISVQKLLHASLVTKATGPVEGSETLQVLSRHVGPCLFGDVLVGGVGDFKNVLKNFSCIDMSLQQHQQDY